MHRFIFLCIHFLRNLIRSLNRNLDFFLIGLLIAMSICIFQKIYHIGFRCLQLIGIIRKHPE